MGATTLATNLAAYYACHGIKTALIDYDSQGSSSDWLERRPNNFPAIQGIAAFRQPHGVTRSYAMRTDRYRLVSWRDHRDLSKEPIFVELYDHQLDPNETVNVAADRPEISADLAAKLDKILKKR